MRRRTIWLITLIAAIVLASCAGKSAPAPSFTDTGKLKVAASFYPLYEFAAAVGGDQIDLVNLVPTGMEPHDWEPTPQHIRTLNAANLFVYNGAGLEPWAGKTLQSLENKALVAVAATGGFNLITGAEPDPHVWLDPQGAIYMVRVIRDAFVRADPAQQATYAAGTAAAIDKLNALDREYTETLSRCARRQFFTSHAAFGYLARRYGLEQNAILGLSPDAEPSPGDLARIVAQAREQQIQYIFFETLVSDRLARVVAGELGAQTLVLNPFEGLTSDEVKAGQNYFTVMRTNLANLKVALECGN